MYAINDTIGPTHLKRLRCGAKYSTKIGLKLSYFMYMNKNIFFYTQKPIEIKGFAG